MIGAKVNWWLDLYCGLLVSPSAIGIAISLARYAKNENIQNIYTTAIIAELRWEGDFVQGCVRAREHGRGPLKLWLTFWSEQGAAESKEPTTKKANPPRGRRADTKFSRLIVYEL
jgi:hypothetical protein